MFLAGIGQVSDFGLTAIAEPIRLGARERCLASTKDRRGQPVRRYRRHKSPAAERLRVLFTGLGSLSAHSSQAA